MAVILFSRTHQLGINHPEVSLGKFLESRIPGLGEGEKLPLKFGPDLDDIIWNFSWACCEASF